MNSKLLHPESPWNTELMLPRVTDNAKLLELQILLGGLSLVLSRVHPAFAKTRFMATRRLAMRLTRGLEYSDATKAHVGSEDLKTALAECEKALDPGTLIVLKKLLAKTVRDEVEYANFDRQIDFTYSDFIAEEQMVAMFTNPVVPAVVVPGAALN
jgi:hypothetical protein